MTIDDEIKQTRWASFRQKALVNVLFTSRAIEDVHSRSLRAWDLTLPQFNILRILRGQNGKPATVKLLTERMLDKSSNASRLVDKLFEKGLVRRVSCPDDRRAVEVTITPEGLRILEEISTKHPEGPSPRSGLSEEEARTLSDLLDRLRASVLSR